MRAIARSWRAPRSGPAGERTGSAAEPVHPALPAPSPSLPRSLDSLGQRDVGRRARAVGRRAPASGARAPARHSSRNSQEALAAPAVEEHVQPGEREVGAAVGIAHRVRAQQARAPSRVQLVQALGEELRQRDRRVPVARRRRRSTRAPRRPGQPRARCEVEPILGQADARARRRIGARRIGFASTTSSQHARERLGVEARARAAARSATGGWRGCGAASRRRTRAGRRRLR